MPRKARSRVFHRPKRHVVRTKITGEGEGESHLPEVSEVTRDQSESQLEQTSSASVDVSEEAAGVFTLDSSPGTASSCIEVPTPGAALLSAALRKLSCQLPPYWIPTADSKGFYVLFLSSGEVKVIQRQIFVSFLGNPTVYVQCYPCALFDEVFSLLHSPKVFSLDSLDEFCQSVLSLVEIVMQYTNCIGLNYLDVQKVRDDHPEICIDSYPFVESGCMNTCRSSSCARLVPRETDDVRCEACLKLSEWVKDKSSEVL